VIGARELALPDKGVAEYEASARSIAAVVSADDVLLGQLLPCSPTAPGDEACFRAFAARLGRLAWRRTLSDAEIDLLTGVGMFAATHADVNDFRGGVREIISALLQSPNFVYLIEIGTPEPSDPKKRWLNDDELATRMSFFLLGETPDAATLDHADSHDLRDVDALRALAKDMVARPRARDAFADFYDELFRLRELEGLGKDQQLFPTWSPALAASMRLETLYFIHEIVWSRDADARELFTADYTFVDQTLADHYGMPAPAMGFALLPLAPMQARAGIVGHGSWLTRLSHPATTSPTRRGLFVRTALLCDEIPPPPPGVATELADDDGTPKTKKEKLAQHQQDPQCASCHVAIDNIGLALEHYDAIGRYRDDDGGMPIDSAMNADDLGTFASASELGQRLADDPRAMTCIVRSLFRGSMGHLETPGESASIEALEAAFEDGAFRVQDLLIELVSSPAFRLVADPK
jgi:hypothetical protein